MKNFVYFFSTLKVCQNLIFNTVTTLEIRPTPYSFPVYDVPTPSPTCSQNRTPVPPLLLPYIKIHTRILYDLYFALHPKSYAVRGGLVAVTGAHMFCYCQTACL